MKCQTAQSNDKYPNGGYMPPSLAEYCSQSALQQNCFCLPLNEIITHVNQGIRSIIKHNYHVTS
jgi:hypothetical protein